MIPPGPKGLPLLGVLPAFRRDPLGVFLNAALTHGRFSRIPVGPITFHLLACPELIRQVVHDNGANYVRSFLYKKMEVVMGKGLITSEGELWRRQRRLMQPAFHAQAVARLVPRMVVATGRMLKRWEAHAGGGGALDVANEMTLLTQEIILDTMFGGDEGAESQRLVDAVAVTHEHMAHKIRTLVDLPEWLPTPRNRRFNRAKRELDAIIDRLVASRRNSREMGSDLLGLLLTSRDDQTGEGMPEKQLRDELITIFFAGHETTANALAWTLMLLARHPEAADRVRGEAAAAWSGDEPQAAALERLPYTRMALEEAMRLYPPVYYLGRQALAPDTLAGYPIRPQDFILISPYVMHHLPEFWPEPQAFRPERFEKTVHAARPRFTYIPFGAGIHTCIGQGFAMTEALMILALILRRFTLKIAADFVPAIAPLITLKPKGGIPMRVERIREYRG